MSSNIHTSSVIGPGAIDRLIREHLASLGLRAEAIHREPATPCTYTADVSPANSRISDPADEAARLREELEQVRAMLLNAFENDPGNAHRVRAALENGGDSVGLAKIVRVFVHAQGAIIRRNITEIGGNRRQIDDMTVTIANLERERDDLIEKMKNNRIGIARLQRTVDIAADIMKAAGSVLDSGVNERLLRESIRAWMMDNLDLAQSRVSSIDPTAGGE